MAATIAGVFPPETQNLIEKSKILLVGAGGIGCEVLKNLVLMGFGELEVIDLDTIEVSNLNRQFLFNKESVGKPKSIVARESVLKFNPNVIIKSHFGDIMDQKYGTAFFNKFKLVINALDNKKARSHVNRMCLSCDIPLIESGTMGYDGQIELIKKGLSACYECFPRQEPKSYPMCTIRNTPREPIHCIIWSKFLFSQLFGDNSEEDVSMEVNTSGGHYCGGTKISAREWAKKNDYNSKKLFKKIFFDDILYLMTMPDLFEGKPIQPVPIDTSLIDQQRSDYSHVPDNKVMDLSQYVTMFLDCVDIIKEKLLSSESPLIWDKDDDNFMNFVVASTNIRSAIFNIPFKTHFDIKSMAGNIVPAIATANAIVAGQIVIHALRILKGKFENCQSVFLRSKPNHKGGMLVKDKVLTKPYINCVVCSTEGEIILSTDINKFTVRQFEDLVLKKKLNMVLPDAMVDGRLIISSDEEDKLDLYNCIFSKVGITHGSRFTVDDYFQNYSIKIMLHHKERTHEELEFEVFGNLEDLKKQSEIPEPKSEDDDCLMDDDASEVKAGDVSNTNKEVTAKEMVDVEQGLKTIDNGEEMDVSNEYEVCGKEKIMVPIDEQVSNEEILATKRKAEDNEEVCESKKVRSDE